MKTIRKIAAATLVVLSGLSLALPAYAVPSLRITQGANVLVVEDGDINDRAQLPPPFGFDAGVVDYLGVVGNFGVDVTGYTKPFLGSSSKPSLDFLSAQFSSSVGGSTVSVEFSDTDFVTGGPAVTFPAKIGGTTNGTLQYQVFASLSNNLFAQDILIADSGALTGAFSFEDAATIALNGSYSLTTIITVEHGPSPLVEGGGLGLVNSSFNATVEISEPALISLTTLSGLMFIVGFANRRRQQRR
jgi:hypothetical protein